MRFRIRSFIEALVEEDAEAALGGFFATVWSRDCYRRRDANTCKITVQRRARALS